MVFSHSSWYRVFAEATMHWPLEGLRRLLCPLPADVDIDIRLSLFDGDSALGFFVSQGMTSQRDAEVLKLLLRHGANPMQKFGNSFLAYYVIRNFGKFFNNCS